jgi:exopolyphosphatase/guanosine-5'-triphosphate,3'-diphosphate pyrophosphatase
MPLSEPVAVIDIGSNSVRLVIYDGLKRSPTGLFNEKLLCGLAKDMNKTKVLNADGVIKAHHAIRRCVKLAKVMGCNSINLFATAAVRDAKDGAKFVKSIKDEFDLDVSVFTGDEEAQYAGLGIVSSIAKVNGITGDLGGGSLELIAVQKDKAMSGVSFPIGPLRIPEHKTREKLIKFIDDHLDKFPLHDLLAGKNFYAVGGAFRSLAKVHMSRKNYPLKVIHNYKVPAEDFLSTIQIVSRMSEASLAKLQGVSSKRAGSLPYAALMLDRIIKKGEPKSIVFAATGVREGYLFSKLCDEKKQEDPLISGCTEMMGRMLRTPHYGYELAEWMAPLFGESGAQQKRLRLASCIMSEISCYENTEYRAEMAYRKILDSSLIGLNHKDRVFIAKALYCRYSDYPDEHILSTMQPLLNDKKIQDAQLIGSAMRLGRNLSCSHSGVLEKAKIRIVKNKLVLKINPEFADLKGEAVTKRLHHLAEIIGLKAELV